VLGFAQQEGKRRDGIPCGYSSQGPTKTGGGRRRAGGVRPVVATREKTHERYEERERERSRSDGSLVRGTGRGLSSGRPVPENFRPWCESYSLT
jgi:hypothetical protein